MPTKVIEETFVLEILAKYRERAKACRLKDSVDLFHRTATPEEKEAVFIYVRFKKKLIEEEFKRRKLSSIWGICWSLLPLFLSLVIPNDFSSILSILILSFCWLMLYLSPFKKPILEEEKVAIKHLFVVRLEN